MGEEGVIGCAHLFGDLPDQPAHRTRSRRDEHDVTLFHLQDVSNAAIAVQHSISRARHATARTTTTAKFRVSHQDTSHAVTTPTPRTPSPLATANAPRKSATRPHNAGVRYSIAGHHQNRVVQHTRTHGHNPEHVTRT